ncbi:MAG TPA: hydroxysqualene dehydroxylase HpnE [Thermoleophilaceae bacterium]
MSGRRVVVVGGGLAGITAALDLAEAGAEVTLLEVRTRLGGAAYSFERDGLEIDNGQHVFLRCCTNYRALLDRLGVTRHTLLQERLSIPVIAPDGRRGTLARTGLPTPLHLAGALATYPFLSPLQRLRAASTARALSKLELEDPSLDSQSFGSWLAQRGESQAAIDSLWNLIALPTLNLPAERASLAMAAKVFQTGLLDAADAGDVGYARVPLSRLHADPAERALREAGVDVRLKTRVHAVRPGLEIESDAGALSADAAVVAVPHDRAAGMLPAGAVNVPLDGLGTSPIVNAHVIYRRAVTDLPLAAGLQTPVQWLFDRTEESGLERGQHLALSLSGADREMSMSNEELRDELLPALGELLPAARDARVEDFFIVREHAATFRAEPGSGRLRPGARTGVPGLFLAGAWTATGWPATMEGAVRSGHTAVSEALATLGNSTPAMVHAA